MYDLLAGKYGFGKSQVLSQEEVLERIPTLLSRTACAAASSITMASSMTRAFSFT